MTAEGTKLLAGEAVDHESGGAGLLAAIEPVTERSIARVDLGAVPPIRVAAELEAACPAHKSRCGARPANCDRDTWRLG